MVFDKLRSVAPGAIIAVVESPYAHAENDMKLIVDFDKEAGELAADDGNRFTEELRPLLKAYSWKPKKGEAVLDLLAEIAECERICEARCEGGDLHCIAVAGADRRLVLVANFADASVAVQFDVGGAAVSSVRLIDNNRTDVALPSLAVLPPLSIALVAFK